MPYVFFDELEEGQQEADVVERAVFDELAERLEQAESQRDAAIDRAVKAEDDYKGMRQKYADTFLSKPRNEPKISSIDLKPQSLEELFGE